VNQEKEIEDLFPISFGTSLLRVIFLTHPPSLLNQIMDYLSPSS
jgi:hypothetical protein